MSSLDFSAPPRTSSDPVVTKGTGLPLRLRQTQLDVGDEVSVVKTSDEFGWPNLNVTLTKARPHHHEIMHRALPLLWMTMEFQPLEASFIVDHREQKCLVPAEGISIVPPETPVGVRRGNDSEALQVFVKDEILSEVAGELFDRDAGSAFRINPLFGVEDSGLAALLLVFRQALDEPLEHSVLRGEYLSRALAVDVLRKYSGFPRREGASMEAVGRLQAGQARLISDYIQENLASEILLNDLARLIGMGRTVFIARFKTSFQQTPHQYITRARIRRAEDLLAKTDLPISQVALGCGFSGQPHFSIYFKRLTGVTPMVYRQQAKGNYAS